MSRDERNRAALEAAILARLHACRDNLATCRDLYGTKNPAYADRLAVVDRVDLESLAPIVADSIEWGAALLPLQAAERAAACARLVPIWPLAIAASRMQGVQARPSRDALIVLGNCGTRWDALGAFMIGVEALRDEVRNAAADPWPVHKAEAIAAALEATNEEQAASIARALRGVLTGDGVTSPLAIVCLARALHAVHVDRIKPMGAVSTRKESRAIRQALAGRAPNAAFFQSTSAPLKYYEVSLPALERVGAQLELPFPRASTGDTQRAAMVRKINALDRERGARDLLALEYMASEQGRTGRVDWSWALHRSITGDDERILKGQTTDAAAHKEASERIKRFSDARLTINQEFSGGRVARVQVGPRGLIDIKGEVLNKDGLIESAIVVIHPNLYLGAAIDAGAAAHYSWVDRAILKLSGPPVRLAVAIAAAARDNLDKEGTIEPSEAWLIDIAGIEGATPDVRGQRLRAALGLITSAGACKTWGIRTQGTTPESTIYRIEQTEAWKDRVLRGVTPAHTLPAIASGSGSEATPQRLAITTGSNLAALRKARGETQATFAAALGVSKRTVERAEALGDRALPPSIMRALLALQS